MLRSMSDSNFLRGARVYLSGPMDFVASRANEKKLGWRNRVGDYLRAQSAIVFGPWLKSGVRGAHLEQRKDTHALQLRDSLRSEVPIKPNPCGIPSLWYMPLVGSSSHRRIRSCRFSSSSRNSSRDAGITD